MNDKLTHFDENGQAIMVDVSNKKETERIAIASGKIVVNKAVYEAIKSGNVAKGDVLGVARIAGIMAAKRTDEMIPLCHSLPISSCKIDFQMIPEESAIKVISTVKLRGLTGVEMEALHSVSIALLTIYDMCKALDKYMEIRDIHLNEKVGGKSGTFNRDIKEAINYA